MSVTPASPAGLPDVGLEASTRRCENSEVFPSGSVAVAVTLSPSPIETGRATLMPALPEPSVVTWAEPMNVRPSRNACGRSTQAGFEKKSRS